MFELPLGQAGEEQRNHLLTGARQRQGRAEGALGYISDISLTQWTRKEPCQSPSSGTRRNQYDTAGASRSGDAACCHITLDTDSTGQRNQGYSLLYPEKHDV